jgi:putative glutamine amidotransferase
MKPVIAITVDYERDEADPRTGGKLQLNWNYAQAVVDAGGIPVLIPPMADMHEVAEMIDGWLIPGGNDIDAKNWGEENHPLVKPIEEERFEGERELMRAVNPDMPVFGICYGCQFINVIRGGNLIQHLPDVVGHEQHTGGTMQDYSVDGSSKLSNLIGSEQISGKSYHHQAIGGTGEGLKVVARGDDGTVEAIESTDRPWMIGVQWHPERTAEDEKTQGLFRSFIEAAVAYAARKRAVKV